MSVPSGRTQTSGTLTPNGEVVRARTQAISATSSSGSIVAAPSTPRPPASETALASWYRLTQDIPPWRIGRRIPSRSERGVPFIRHESEREGGSLKPGRGPGSSAESEALALPSRRVIIGRVGDPRSSSRTTAGRLRRIIGLGLVLLALDQVVLFTLCADGELAGVQLAPFSPPLFSDHQRSLLENYRSLATADASAPRRPSQFDADLGWCPRPSSTVGLARFDALGARIAERAFPVRREASSRRVAAFGCSFTHGSEVAGDESWIAELERRDSALRVANFGVGGYGLDQALVRYRRDASDLDVDEVWWGFFPHAALRTTSHFPPLYHRWRGKTIFFKPRAVVADDGSLELRPSPARTLADLPFLLEDPTRFLEAVGSDDTWVARAPAAYAPPGTHWSHRFASARLVLTALERRGRAVPPRLSDRTSQLYRVHVELARVFADEVRERGARFRVLVLPGGHELRQLESEGRAYWAELLDAWRAQGIEVVDVSTQLVDAGGLEDAFWMPGGHYSPAGHRAFAAALAPRLGER